MNKNDYGQREYTDCGHQAKKENKMNVYVNMDRGGNKYIYIIVLLTMILLSGCSDKKTKSFRTPAEELVKWIAKEGPIEFLSWNGKWIGTDCDTSIILFSDNTIHIIEYGIVRESYYGTYRINDKGELYTKLPTYKSEWPVMVVRKDSRSLVLMPKDNSGSIMGNRHNMYIPGNAGNYWPFRPTEDEGKSMSVKKKKVPKEKGAILMNPHKY